MTESLVIIADRSDKPYYVLPGDSLNLTLSVDPSGEDKAAIHIDLKIDFREPFSSDSIVVISARADVKYAPKE